LKTLILSCNNGGGHNSVAAAIQEVYVSHGETADIIDAMSFLPRGWSKIASSVHSYVYRHKPEIFRYGYEKAEKNRNQFSKGKATRNLLNLGSGKLGRYIQKNGYDCVICCHVFAGIMLTDAIKKQKLDIASGVIETDYTVSPGAEKSNLDWHFVPTAQQKEKLIGLGVPEERIAVCGIPVRAQFGKSQPKEEAKKKLGIPSGKKNIVVCCGSMGCGPMEELAEALSKLWKDDSSFVVMILCANNRKLYESMSEKYGSGENIRILGETDDMSLMLDSADVLMTKPGGISTTEAMQKAVPMVLINVVGGCEEYNLDFFVSTGGAVTSDSVKVLAAQAVEICENKALHEKMQKALKAAFAENDKEKIYTLMKR